MTNAIRAAVVVGLIGVAAGVSAAEGIVNITDLIGKNRLAITAVFPGQRSTVKQWHGWDSVMLVSGRQGTLVAIVLEPASQISEQDAEDAVRQLGVTVDTSKYFAGPTEHGYSDLSGPIRTVIYDIGADGKVIRIGLYSTLADSDY